MVTITPNAAAKLKELIAEKNKDTPIPETAGLRLYVKGGGCSGFEYGLQLESEPKHGDKIFESNGVKIFVDHISLGYLKGSEIFWHGDYNNLMGGGFKVKNPDTKSTCGCGSSFKPKQTH